MSKKIIVTGGSGFIGSAVCRYLVMEKQVEVLNIDKLTYAGVPASLKEIEDSPLYRFEKVDVCDKNAVAALFADFQPDAVMHLAAESHVDRSIDGPSAFIETNIVGTYTMLECALAYWSTLEGDGTRHSALGNSQSTTNDTECARKRKGIHHSLTTHRQLPTANRQPPKAADFRFHHISTDEVYGSLGDEGLFDERPPYAPRSPYSASKASSDHLVMAWHHTYGLPVIITNCSNNYGPCQFPEKLIPVAILNALKGKPIPIYGKGDQVRDWLHVEDHARALVQVVGNGRAGETYNVGGRNERTNLEVVEAICTILDEIAPLSQRTDVGGQTSANSDIHLLPETRRASEQKPKASGLTPKALNETTRSYRELISFVPDRPGHDQRYAIDATKLKTELGWKAQEGFDSGIRKTVQWYLDNEWWWKPLITSRERT